MLPPSLQAVVPLPASHLGLDVCPRRTEQS